MREGESGRNTCNSQFQCDPSGNTAYLIQGDAVNALGRSDQCRVSGMNTRVLHMLRHCHAEDHPVVRHCVHVYLLRVLDELGNDHLGNRRVVL